MLPALSAPRAPTLADALAPVDEIAQDAVPVVRSTLAITALLLLLPLTGVVGPSDTCIASTMISPPLNSPMKTGLPDGSTATAFPVVEVPGAPYAFTQTASPSAALSLTTNIVGLLPASGARGGTPLPTSRLPLPLKNPVA